MVNSNGNLCDIPLEPNLRSHFLLAIYTLPKHEICDDLFGKCLSHHCHIETKLLNQTKGKKQKTAIIVVWTATKYDSITPTKLACLWSIPFCCAKKTLEVTLQRLVWSTLGSTLGSMLTWRFELTTVRFTIDSSAMTCTRPQWKLCTGHGIARTNILKSL